MNFSHTLNGCVSNNSPYQRVQAALTLNEKTNELCRRIMEWEVLGAVDQENMNEECANIMMLLYDMSSACGLDLRQASEKMLSKRREKIEKIEMAFINRSLAREVT